MFRRLSMALVATMFLPGAAHADPIEGNWKTQSGETAAIGGCGGGFCITVKTGKYAGKQIGKMNASGDNKYKGTITDPADDKTIFRLGQPFGIEPQYDGLRAQDLLQDAEVDQAVAVAATGN
jgi:hypothetical protein